MVRRRCSEPPDFRPASWSGHPTGSPIPVPAASIHQLHQMPDPLVSISNSPDSIHHQEIYPPDSRLWRSLTGVITVNTSNFILMTSKLYNNYHLFYKINSICKYSDHILITYNKKKRSNFTENISFTSFLLFNLKCY